MSFIRNALIVSLLLVFSTSSLMAETVPQITPEAREVVESFREMFRDTRSLYSPSRNMRTANVIDNRIFQFIEADNWINEVKEDFFYDEHGRLEEVKMHHWDFLDEEWTPSFMSAIIEWNEHDLVDELKLRVMSPVEMDVAVITKEYNENQQIIEMIMEEMDQDSGMMELMMEANFHYDANGHIDYMTMYRPFWEEYENLSVTLDDNNRLSEAIIEESDDGENFYLWEKEVFEYHPDDTSGYAEVQDFLNFLGPRMAFEPMTWWEAPMYEAEYLYEWIDNDWEPYSQYLYTYYPDNLLESRIREYYHDYLDDPWDTWERMLYTYTDDGHLIEVLYQYEYDEDIGWEDEERVLMNRTEITNVDDEYLKPVSLNITNYPNPFNPETTISFHLPEGQPVELTVLNIRGRKIKKLIDEEMPSGMHSVSWDGRDSSGRELSSGVYFYRLTGEQVSETGKMLLLK